MFKKLRLAGYGWVALLILFNGCGKEAGDVTVWNKTHQGIADGLLKIGPELFDISGLAPGGSRVFSFSSAGCSPCEYQVSVQLKNQLRAVESIGAIRRGMDYHDTLTINKKEVVLESSQNPTGNQSYIYKGTQSRKIKWFR